MHLSLPDIITILGPILGLLGLVWHYMNGKFDKIDEQFERLEKKLTERIDAVAQELKVADEGLANKIGCSS